MAAILQFRQGSKTSFISSGPYISEPFFDTDTNIIHIGVSGSSTITLTKLEDINSGSFSVSGDISGSNLYLSGDITASNTLLSGDITIGGNIILGDQVQDNITVSGQFDSDLIPSASATYNLGSPTKKWNHLYVESASIDSVNLVANLPSGVISGSSQLTLLGFDGYGGWYVDGDNTNPIYVNSGRTIDFEGRNGIITEARNPGNYYISIDLDTGSAHFTNAVAGVGAPQGTVSGSQQVIDLLPSGVVSGSSQIEITQISQINDTLYLEGTEVWSSTDSLLITPFAVDKRFDSKGVISGSSQVEITQLSQINDGLFLQGTEVWSSTDSLLVTPFAVDKRFDSKGLISGSSQITPLLPNGIVSGSSQIPELSHLHTFTSSFDTAISLNSSDVTILGNLTVQGTQTQLNTATLNVEDLNILLASGSTTSAEADGAGISIDGANKSLIWNHGDSNFLFDAQVSSSVGFSGDGSNLTGLTADSVEYANILNKPTLVSGSDQILGGTNIVSSSTQVINFLPSGTVSGSVQVLGGTSIVSSSNQVISYLPSGTISGSTQIIEILEVQTPGLISGSDQVTASLDLKYLEIDGDNVLSSSNENFTDFSESVDLRLLDTLSSGSETSQSLHVLVGNFPTSGSLGTAAFYNVSSSLSDDPDVVPNVKAVYDYINNVVQAADITGVSASLGLLGGGNAGYVSLSLDTASAHFQNAVQAYQSYYGGWYARADVGTSQYISSYEPVEFRGDVITNDITTSVSQALGVTYVSFQLNTGSAHFLNGVAAAGAPQGTISSSAQITSFGFISASTFLYNDQYNLAIGTNSPTNLGATQFTINDSNTAGISGLISFTDSGVVKSYDYVLNNYRYIDTNTGVGIALKPNADGTKAWIVDTDGDLVSNGGSWASGNAYMNNLIASSSVTASNMLVDNDIIANNFIGSIQADNGVISGSKQITDFGFISESNSLYIDANDFSFGGTPQNAFGLNQITIRDDNTGYSGLLAFQDNTTVQSFDYVASPYRYIDTNTGIGIVLKPDSDGTKSWVIDTDGDLVSNGGSWASGNAYMNNLIASSSVTASNLLVDNDITTNNLTADGNITVSGNLTVSGTTTYTSTNNVNIGDNILELNFGGSATTGGILVKDATGVNTQSGSLLWDATNDYWKAGRKGFESKVLIANGDNIISGSSQVIVGGDATGSANDINVIAINGVTITNAEATQLANIDTTTISATQWGYLGGLTATDTELNQLDGVSVGGTTAGDIVTIDGTQTLTNKTITAAQVTEISSLTADEGAQLENIDSVTISNTQWGYLGASDQGIATTDDVTFNTVSATGDIVAYASSDRRLKDEIQPISNPIEKISKIGGYSFVWNTEKQHIYKGKDYGVIAQEIEEILPELVDTRETGYKAVKYDRLVSLLIEGIKELSEEVKELKEKINNRE